MYERSYGNRYHETQGLGRAAIAKLIRADVKTAKADGTLPDWLNVSVRTEEFSMGGAIEMTVRFDDRLWEPCDGFAPGSKHEYEPGLFSGTACRQSARYGGHEDHERLNDLGRDAVATLEALHAAYNYDGSETQSDYFDVRYYGQVVAENRFSAAFWAHDKEVKAARKAARAARRAAA